MQSAVACAQRAATTQDGREAREALQLVLQARREGVVTTPASAPVDEEVVAWS